MENKEFRNALIEAMKNELKDFAQVQRDLKKSRKLQYRPKDRSLQDIVDEINRNASKISTLLFYYCWIRHGLKYWTNTNIGSLWEYVCTYGNIRYPISYKDKEVTWINIYDTTLKKYIPRPYTTYEESVIYDFKEFVNTKIHEYDMQALTDYDFLINK